MMDDTAAHAPSPDPGDAPAGADGGPSRRRRLTVIVGSAAAIVAVVALLIVGLMNQGVSRTIQDALDQGQRPAAPALDLPLLVTADGLGEVGDTIGLSDLEGRIVVLNFWASWCDPCKSEAPILEGIARGYRERGEDVVVLGNDIQDVPGDAEAFIRDHDISYASLRDGSGDSERRWETTGVPETFIIDRDGRIALKLQGEVTRPEELTVAIEQLLKEPAGS